MIVSDGVVDIHVISTSRHVVLSEKVTITLPTSQQVKSWQLTPHLRPRKHRR